MNAVALRQSSERVGLEAINTEPRVAMTRHYITGIAGFIGIELADKLLETGAQVGGIDDYSLGRPEHLSRRG